jgi:hypothetical protein
MRRVAVALPGVGSTSLKQSELGIAPISIAGGRVKVKDEMKIDFDIVATGR